MATQQSHTPDDVSIQPRNRQHDISQALRTDWMKQDIFQTAWFNAMSITFPLGEKFFIDSARFFADDIEDPELKENLSKFCGQEGFHRREHQRYNETLCAQRGYDLEALEAPLRRRLSFVRRNFSPLQQLAATAGVEHITAVLAEQLLNDHYFVESTDPTMVALWRWHAAEEMEHKSVAFDVYKAVGGGEKMRKRALRRSTVFLTLDIFRGVRHMLKRDGHLWNFKVWRSGFRFLFGRQGMVWAVRRSYMEYYRNGFHPWDQDTRALLEQWRTREAAA